MAKWARLREAQKKKVLPTHKVACLMQEGFAVVTGPGVLIGTASPGRLSHHLPQICEEKSYLLPCLPSVSAPGMGAGGGQAFFGRHVTTGI